MCTRPNISHAVGAVSWFLSNQRREQWPTIKWILRYLRGASWVSLCFSSGEPILDEYTNSDMADDIDSIKSNSWWLLQGELSFSIHSYWDVPLYPPQKLKILLLLKVANKALKIKEFLEELSIQQEKCIIYNHNQSSLPLQEFNVPLKIQAYLCQISLDLGYLGI